jgi:transcriptional regulator with XRE-family HTH domain
MESQERVKELRKTLDLTMEKFGNRLGVTKVAISNIENGNRKLTEQMIKSICREFDVDENWLRTGKGKMFLPVSRERDLARLTKNLLNEESTSFKNRFISMLAGLTKDEWAFLERKAKELLDPISDCESESTLDTSKVSEK